MKTKQQIKKEWQFAENKKKLEKLIKTFGKYKFIQILDYDGKSRYFKVLTKKIIIEGIKAEELLLKKYGKEILQAEFKKETKKV